MFTYKIFNSGVKYINIEIFLINFNMIQERKLRSFCSSKYIETSFWNDFVCLLFSILITVSVLFLSNLSKLMHYFCRCYSQFELSWLVIHLFWKDEWWMFIIKDFYDAITVNQFISLIMFIRLLKINIKIIWIFEETLVYNMRGFPFSYSVCFKYFKKSDY